MALQFTYTGSEALEMIKTTFPKTWEQEILEGQTFIQSIMNMYKLSANDAYAKFLRQNGSVENAISTLASLYVMSCQHNIGAEIDKCKRDQLACGNQITALENSKTTSFEDKKTLRKFYLDKQEELENRIQNLIFDYPIIGAQRVVVQTNLFES